MPKPKKGTSPEGKPMHYASGAIIKKNGKYLLIDRAIEPLGFACPAGHIDEGEDPVTALKREVKEETSLNITSYKQIYEEFVPWNWCNKGVTGHYRHIFECEVSGTPKHNKESKSIGWYSPEEIKKLKMEPIWEYTFKKLKII